MNTLELIGRNSPLFLQDTQAHQVFLRDAVERSSFLVLGGAGSIGQAVVKEIFKRQPKKLHVVDISENNLVELVRDLRSSYGYIEGEFKTFTLDIGDKVFEAYFEDNAPFDYVLNLSALKHVRSEKDPYTLMRMLDVNIVNTIKTLDLAIRANAKKYFCVSTDKASNPVNMMGASKRIMEMFLARAKSDIDISTARFANVAFSDGSLLHGFNQRLAKGQPLAAPTDVKRYFLTPQESGELCLMSCLLGNNEDIFFPQLDENQHLLTFSEIAKRFLVSKGLTPYICDSEEQARNFFASSRDETLWPCWFSESDTTGEKATEEFFTVNEALDLQRFKGIGVITNSLSAAPESLQKFETELAMLRSGKRWNKADILELFSLLLPDFSHVEMGKYLESKM